MTHKTKSANKNYIFLITTTAALGGFLFGFDTAVISGTIAFVKKQFDMNEIMEGWFVSSALLGCIVGVAASGKLSDIAGRKKVMLLAALLFAISATGCAFSVNSFWLISFRIIGGLGIGVASVICPLYIAELSPPAIRGKLVSYYQLAITLGILIAYFSNASIQSYTTNTEDLKNFLSHLFMNEPWRAMFIMGVFPAFLFVVLILFIPESPRWLVMKKNYSLAKNILEKISGEMQAEEDIKQITASQEIETIKLSQLFRGKLALPMMIGITLAALSQFSGINAIIYYGPSILEKAGFQLGEALGGQVTIGIVNTIFTFIAIYVIDRFGRKPLLLWGIAGAVIALLVAGILFSMNITNGWLILLCIILFIACFAFSFGPVVWVIISEIFPTNVRAHAVAISTMSLWIANWLVGQFFPILNKQPGVPFFAFSIFSLIAFWITLKKVPETKGKSLEEIEKFW